MESFEWERAGDHASAATDPPHACDAIDWITERQDATVERLFALLEQNQAAIGALAQAWRHTRRALELSQAELADTKRALAIERLIHCQPAPNETPSRSHAAA
jgi:hypothetical protein